MKPFHVARAIISARVGTVTADTTAPVVLECLVRLNTPWQNPGLEHGPGLTVRGSLTETGDDADDRGTVIGRHTLPKDATVWID